MCIELTQQPLCGACGQRAAKIEGPIVRCGYPANFDNAAICQYLDEDCRDVEVPWTDACAHNPPFGGWQPTTMEQTLCILRLMRRYLGLEEFGRQSEVARLAWGEDWIDQIQDALLQERGLHQQQIPAIQEGGSNNGGRGSPRDEIVDAQPVEFVSKPANAMNNIDDYDLQTLDAGPEAYAGADYRGLSRLDDFDDNYHPAIHSPVHGINRGSVEPISHIGGRSHQLQNVESGRPEGYEVGRRHDNHLSAEFAQRQHTQWRELRRPRSDICIWLRECYTDDEYHPYYPGAYGGY